ncbi:aquaporin AQPAn.G-like isoform X1 [Leptidea sinapis]|uniref:aquaporin AQPAn.G-like isoform X1 n=1 Tax=Leptidea sinapis TaxID=189913 RepID=UPI00212B3432|nr:aquaporin AQPAn.G-like isoform X1 [Leptidea sinapis]
MASEDDTSTVIRLPSGYQRHCKSSSSVAGRASEGNALWHVVAAELVGTAMLLFFTCLPVCLHGQGSQDGHGPTLLERAFAAGLLVACIVQCFDHVSGAQLNPTVTLAAALSGKVTPGRALAMCVAQCAGALLGTTTAALITADVTTCGAHCITTPASHLSSYQAMTIEGCLGGCLALANLASWDARNRRLVDSWPLRIGLTVAALTLAAGDLTGASMNPVRSLAPAMLGRNFHQLWVYIVGPLSGSCVCSALYLCVWRVSPRVPARPTSPPPSPAFTRKTPHM